MTTTTMASHYLQVGDDSSMCRGSGWNSIVGWPKHQKRQSTDDCRALCSEDVACTAFDVARKDSSGKYDCWLFGHQQIEAANALSDERCFKKISGNNDFETSLAVSSASGRSIKVADPAKVGDKVFTDRDYTFTSVGDYPGCKYILGANDDKNTAASSVQWTLTVETPVDVYLDFWGGAAHEKLGFSSWKDGWSKSEKAGARFGTSPHFWGPGAVYKKHFQAGTVALDGNGGNGHGTYLAFVCPALTPAPTPAPTPAETSAPGTCSSAGATVKTVTTDIKTKVVPKLEEISFNHTLAVNKKNALAANETAWALRKAADNSSTSLDTCRGTESG